MVEDNEINRAALCAILSSQYTVLEAENGAQALSLLEKYREGISLILLDIVMPVMDGYTFLKHLKADHRLNSIPVIVTTSNNSEADEVAALSNRGHGLHHQALPRPGHLTPGSRHHPPAGDLRPYPSDPV